MTLLPLLFATLLAPPAQAGKKNKARKQARKMERRAERLAQEDLPRDTRQLTDFTAYTPPKGQWRMGINNFEYGLLDNLQLATRPIFWFLAPNVQGKVTAVQAGPVDLSLEAGIYRLDLSRFGGNFTGAFVATPFEWKASWTVGDRLSLYGGTAHWSLRLNAGLDGEQLGEAISIIAGSDISEDLSSLGADAYGESRLALHQLNLAADWRFSRRGALIFESNSYLLLTGLISAGSSISNGDSDGTTTVGASVGLTQPLSTVPSATSIAWQWSWPNFHLRVGLPLTFSNPLSYTQAFSFYWVLGPQENDGPPRLRRRAKPAPKTTP